MTRKMLKVKFCIVKKFWNLMNDFKFIAIPSGSFKFIDGIYYFFNAEPIVKQINKK